MESKLISIPLKLVFCISVLLLFSCKRKIDATGSVIDIKKRPNVIFIYTDDVGYGDIGAYGATLIKTPNIDKLASEGIRFTDGHCAASTCSPSRFSLLTGDMAFRKNISIQGINGKLAIDPNTYTFADMFKAVGYNTGVIGKWHLGLGNGVINWNEEITPGPLDLGFDYSFLIPSTNDRAPFVYVENKNVYNLDKNDPITAARRYHKISDLIPGTKYPDAIENPDSITLYKGDAQHSGSVINGIGRIGYMKGGKKALWNDYTMPEVLLKKTKEFVTKTIKSPFFLYLSTCDVHAPRLPHPRFQGKTGLGYRADNILQLDWFVGEVMEFLKLNELEKNTLVVFTSDNGPVYHDGYNDGVVEGNHKASGKYRGGKYKIYEGGTRVPFIIKWPNEIKPKVSNALVSQVDFLASFASFFKIKLPNNTAMDSRNCWSTFMGENEKGVDVILEQTNKGEKIALRKGKMKFIKTESNSEVYDLEIDPSEKNNIIGSNIPEVNDLEKLLNKYINNSLVEER